jgi:hypothetical protein
VFIRDRDTAARHRRGIATSTNNGALVTLGARYELVGDSLIIKVLTTHDGNQFTCIVFHKVSRD